jgi:hypothetical protein
MNPIADNKHEADATPTMLADKAGATKEPAKPKAGRKSAKPVKPSKQAKKAKPAKKAAAKKESAPKKEARTSERSNKKADVLAMMQRAKGVTLAEIIEATGWQRHTVRGFVSILGSKGGHTIESSKNAAGERMYKIAK